MSSAKDGIEIDWFHTNKPDKSSVAFAFNRPEEWFTSLRQGNHPIDARVAARPIYGWSEMLHDSGVSIHCRKRGAIFIAPMPQD